MEVLDHEHRQIDLGELVHECLDLLLVLDDVHRGLAEDAVGSRLYGVASETLGALHVGVADACRDVDPPVHHAYDLFDEARPLLVGELRDFAGDRGHDAAGNAILDAPLDEPFERREIDAVVLRPRRVDDRNDAG